MGIQIYARSSGSTGADGSDTASGSSNDPFLTVSKALSVCQPDDEIFIDGDFYEMKLVMDKARSRLRAWPGATRMPQIIGGKKITVAWTGPVANIYTAVQDLGAGWSGVTQAGGGAGQSIGLTADYGIVAGTTKRMLTDARGKVRPYGHLKQVATATNASEFKCAMAGTTATITARLFGDADPNTKTMVLCVSNTVAGSGTGLGIGLYIKADGCKVEGIWFNRFMCWDTGQGYAIQCGYGTSNGGCTGVTINDCRFSDCGWHALGWPDLICKNNWIVNCIFDHTNGDNGSGDYGTPTVFRSGNTTGTTGDTYATIARGYGCDYRCSLPIMESGIAYLPMPRGGTALAGAHHNHTDELDEPVTDCLMYNCTASYDVANDIGAGSPAGARGSPWRGLNGKSVAAADRENWEKYGIKYQFCQAVNVDRTESGDNVAFRRCSFKYDVVNASIQAMITTNATFGSQITTAGYDASLLFDSCELVCAATGAGPSLSRFYNYLISGASATRVQRLHLLNCTLIQNYTSRMVGFQSQGTGLLYVTARQTIFAWPLCTATNCLFLFDDATANKIIVPVFADCWYPLDARFGGAAGASFTSTTAYNTRNKWSGVDVGGTAVDTTGIYNTAPAFAQPTVDASPTAGGNLETTRIQPRPRVFLGINGKLSNGRYGPYQGGAPGGRSKRGRGRGRAGSLAKW